MKQSLEKEIENLSHTLNDVNTSLKCSKKLLEGHSDLVKRLEPRIEDLKMRIDRLTIEFGDLKNEKTTH